MFVIFSVIINKYFVGTFLQKSEEQTFVRRSPLNIWIGYIYSGGLFQRLTTTLLNL